MKNSNALVSGLAGATAVSMLHETIRRFNPKAPRMDLLGMQAISSVLKKVNVPVPEENKLFGYALAGDIVSNAFYYSLIKGESKKSTWAKGIALGTAAGLGAVLLPGPLGLNKEYSNKTTETKLITFGLYFIGGVITAALMNRRKS